MLLTQQNTILRPLQNDDLATMAELANNKKIWDNVRDYFPHPYTIKDAYDFLHQVQQQPVLVTFAITYHNAFTGVIGLVPMDDVYRFSAKIGYWLGEPFWHKGIATTAVQLVTACGLEQLEFCRLHAGIFEYNTVSMLVLEKCGYELEGIFKKSVYKNGRLWNEHRYAKTI